MIKNSLSVAVLPMTSIDDSKTNLAFIKEAFQKLDPSVRLFCLPENSLYLNLDKSPIPREAAFSKDSPEILELCEMAKDKGTFIHLGGIPWLIDGEVYNEALVINDYGQLIETYEKQHLFDVNLGPGIEIMESRSYCGGHRLNTFEVDGWKIATCICYDVRFPEIFVHYMENEGVQAFVVPAAFTTKTGEIHWKPLLQARAIETQAYVIAPAQVGYHRDLKQEKLRKSWGQSLIFDPWGKVLQETPCFREFLDSKLTQHEPIHSVMEMESIEAYKKSIPVSDHRYYKMELVKK